MSELTFWILMGTAWPLAIAICGGIPAPVVTRMCAALGAACGVVVLVTRIA